MDSQTLFIVDKLCDLLSVALKIFKQIISLLIQLYKLIFQIVLLNQILLLLKGNQRTKSLNYCGFIIYWNNRKSDRWDLKSLVSTFLVESFTIIFFYVEIGGRIPIYYMLQLFRIDRFIMNKTFYMVLQKKLYYFFT